MGNSIDSIKGVELTGIVTLFFSEYAHESGLCINKDPVRSQIVDHFSKCFKDSGKNPHNILMPEKQDANAIANVALRNKAFDFAIREAYRKKNISLILDIGCGFSTRFFRLKDFKGHYYDIDLPEVINGKRSLIDETDRYRMIGADAFNQGFFPTMKKAWVSDDRILIISEGLFCYHAYEDVLRFVKDAFSSFPQAVMICDTYLFEENFQFSDIRSKLMLRFPNNTDAIDCFTDAFALLDKCAHCLSRPFKKLAKKLASDKEWVHGNIGLECSVKSDMQDVSAYWIGIYKKKPANRGAAYE